MGSISRSYPEGKLKLRAPKKAQPDKKYQVYIEYNWQADNARKSTGISVFTLRKATTGHVRLTRTNPTTLTASTSAVATSPRRISTGVATGMQSAQSQKNKVG